MHKGVLHGKHGSDMLMWISQCANALCRAFQLKINEVARRLALVIALVNYQASIKKTRGGKVMGTQQQMMCR